MLKDITLKITKQLQKKAPSNQLLAGHLGTHFDCMNKQFPLEYARSKGYIIDVSTIREREVTINDVDLSKITKDMFVGFCFGFLDEVGYGTEEYHFGPELSKKLIDALLEKKVRMIGVDLMGVRRGKEHTPTDQYCADHDVFIIENLCNMKNVTSRDVIVNVYPLSFEGTTGLPCRVIVEY